MTNADLNWNTTQGNERKTLLPQVYLEVWYFFCTIKQLQGRLIWSYLLTFYWNTTWQIKRNNPNPYLQEPSSLGFLFCLDSWMKIYSQPCRFLQWDHHQSNNSRKHSVEPYFLRLLGLIIWTIKVLCKSLNTTIEFEPKKKKRKK